MHKVDVTEEKTANIKRDVDELRRVVICLIDSIDSLHEKVQWMESRINTLEKECGIPRAEYL
jgi:peptidoglycan hydrolase CwlO-like protein